MSARERVILGDYQRKDYQTKKRFPTVKKLFKEITKQKITKQRNGFQLSKSDFETLPKKRLIPNKETVSNC